MLMGLVSHTWPQSHGMSDRAWVAGYPRAITDRVDQIYHGPESASRLSHFRNAVDAVLATEYPWSNASYYMPRTLDRLDHISTMTSAAIHCAALRTWPHIVRAVIMLICCCLHSGDQALCLVTCLPSRHEYERQCPTVAAKGVSTTCVTFISEVLRRMGKMPSSRKLAAEDVSVVKARNVAVLNARLGAGDQLGLHKAEFHRTQDSNAAVFHRLCDQPMDLITRVSGVLHMLNAGELHGSGRELDGIPVPEKLEAPPVGDPAELLRFYARHIVAKLPGTSDLAVFPVLVGFHELGLWCPSSDVWSMLLRPPVEDLLAASGPVRLPIPLGGDAKNGAKGALVLAGWTVRDYLEYLVSLDRPELLFYSVFENVLCEAKRWLESSGFTTAGAAINLTARRPSIKITVWSGLPVLVNVKLEDGSYGVKWQPCADGVNAQDLLQAWARAGPSARRL